MRIGIHTVTFGQEVGSGRQSVMSGAPGWSFIETAVLCPVGNALRLIVHGRWVKLRSDLIDIFCAHIWFILLTCPPQISCARDFSSTLPTSRSFGFGYCTFGKLFMQLNVNFFTLKLLLINKSLPKVHLIPTHPPLEGVLGIRLQNFKSDVRWRFRERIGEVTWVVDSVYFYLLYWSWRQNIG